MPCDKKKRKTSIVNRLKNETAGYLKSISQEEENIIAKRMGRKPRNLQEAL